MPSLTYTTNIPDPPHSPSVDVPDMKTNTNSAYTIWTADHFTFSDANPGLHKQVQINSAGGIPPGLQNGFETLYAKAAAGSGELFFTRGNSGIEIQMTGPGAPSATPNGYTFLPGGILLQWGRSSGGSLDSNGKITFPIAFPNNLFVVNPTLISKSGGTTSTNTISYVTGTGSTTSWQWNYTGTTSYIGFYWMAIGN